MNHLKEAIKNLLLHMESQDSGDMQAPQDEMMGADNSEQAPELGSGPSEMMAGGGEKDKIMGALMAKGDGRNPSSLHKKAADHHKMKGMAHHKGK